MSVREDLSPAGRTSADDAQTPFEAGGRRPQDLVFSFFGGVVQGRDLPPIPTSVFLRLFSGLGAAEASARATLARMTRRGLLERVRDGRSVRFRLTATAAELLRKGDQRVSAEAPFEHPDGQWTLLSYSMPESRRDLRHKLRSALVWAGFGGVRDGLWIAPGTVDVAAVFADAGLPEAVDLAEWFSASPLPGVDVESLIRRAWPVDRIGERHNAFITAWWDAPHDEDPLVQITLLGADWLQVLRADPGLPARFLAPDWPAAQSAAVFRRCYAALLPAAERELRRELGVDGVG